MNNIPTTANKLKAGLMYFGGVIIFLIGVTEFGIIGGILGGIISYFIFREARKINPNVNANITGKSAKYGYIILLSFVVVAIAFVLIFAYLSK